MKFSRTARAGLLASLLLVTTACEAADWREAETEPCRLGSLYERVDCVTQLTAQWDRRLNAAYERAMHMIDPARARTLRDVQRKWIEWRDANCGWYAHQAGTMSLELEAECLRVTTKQRAEELEDFEDYY
ncbi:lysozyme inhibitor LprI family protein [Consotaella salsifontis]|uniref:Uncharacterized conserved protein YecT, DUF1311 family n=1 Tax=Consotaella salsifontis TaxID=1365950 RepID=A0A1T4NIG2_9HYPH|nr:lysozyme inhibitor LprI family protein [Consotaella salsifontis]SJZ78913.1 Uncharacterized conserved protein YecT, DUF1311 family [Consotaella salsifontis]